MYQNNKFILSNINSNNKKEKIKKTKFVKKSKVLKLLRQSKVRPIAKYSGEYIVLIAYKVDESFVFNHFRISVTVSTRVAKKAVDRNKIRRQIKHIIAKNLKNCNLYDKLFTVVIVKKTPPNLKEINLLSKQICSENLKI